MLSAAGTKRGLYLLPLVAPFGAVAGAWFASVVKDEQPHAIDRVTVSILLDPLRAGRFRGAARSGRPGTVRFYLTPEGAEMANRIPRVNLILFSLIGAVFLWLAFFGSRLLRRGRPRVAALVVWMAFGLTLTGMPLVYRSLDPFKNLHRFTADLVRMDAFSPDLITWKPDEVTRGDHPF